MLELQKEFCLVFLMPFLTEAHLPLVSVQNPGAQRNDVPERLEIVGPEYKTGPRLEDLYWRISATQNISQRSRFTPI